MMAEVTVKQLAQIVGIQVERLLNQLQEAGLPISDEQHVVNEDQKRILLNHLKGVSRAEGEPQAPERITLRRKSVSQVTIGHDAHSGKTVNIEVRKKRTYVKRSSLLEQEAEEAAPSVEPSAEETLEAIDLLVNEGGADAALEVTPAENTLLEVQAEPIDLLPLDLLAVAPVVEQPETVKATAERHEKKKKQVKERK